MSNTEAVDLPERYWPCIVPGKRHYGAHGAAGIIPFTMARGRAWVAMSLRSRWVQDGNTWAGFGGAIEAGETAWAAAVAETDEEVDGLRLGAVVAKFRDYCPEGCGWSYTTYIVRARNDGGRLPRLSVKRGPHAWETTMLAWVPLGKVREMTLHPGYAATVNRNTGTIARVTA